MCGFGEVGVFVLVLIFDFWVCLFVFVFFGGWEILAVSNI
jgi:hypothetical protein